MTSTELENLVRIRKLKREPPARPEFDGLMKSGRARLADAANRSLALESRFDLAYNGAHALALAALRRLGYRSDNRYLVFQVLGHTLGIPSPTWRVLATCHEERNQFEYGGVLDVNDGMVTDLLNAASSVLAALEGVQPPEPEP